MNYNELTAKIEKGVFVPLYLFYGEETFLIDDAVERIASTAVEPSNRDFNVEIIKGGETTYQEIINKAQTLPFIGERRVVIVKGIDEMKAQGLERLIEYCSNPSPSTCLVFAAAEIDKRSKLYNILSKSGVIVEFNHVNEKYAGVWITKKVKESGFQMNEDAKKYLLDIVGSRLQRLAMELEKIFTFKGNDRNITTDDIKLLVEDTKIETIFTFTDSIGSKDIDGAFKLLSKMLNQGEAAIKIIGMIARQLRLILLTKTYREKGIPLSDLPSKAGFAPFLLKGYLGQAEKYNVRELKESFFKIQEADIRLKSSDIPEKMILEKLVLDLCGSRLGGNRINKMMQPGNLP
jgi:DNA polymerase-3 subunit delta